MVSVEDSTLTRRRFITQSCKFGAAFWLSSFLPDIFPMSELSAVPSEPTLHEAHYYTKLDSETTQCLLCPNACIRKSGGRSKCLARENRNGTYYSLVYNAPCVIHLDPIEKLPIYHYLPGTNVFSIATAGCNLTCKYCQNWQFSQRPPEKTDNYSITPREVVAKAREANCSAVAYFYTEPVVYYEYMVDIAHEAKKKGLKNIMVTAGYINPDPLKELIPLMNAFTVGLKGFTDSYYEDTIGGRLEVVLNTLKILEQHNAWYEIVTLIVPTLNDNMDDIRKMCSWVKSNLSVDKPIHFSRFVPEFQLRNLPITPQRTLDSARAIAQDVGLHYVYIDNLPGHEASNTCCPMCRTILVERVGFKVIKNDVRKGKCPKCGEHLSGPWS